MEQRPLIFDLHGHTNRSLPEILSYNYKQAIDRAKLLGLNGIAITEHNTLRGLREALEYADRREMIVVPGVEVSDLSFSGIMPTSHHILILGIDPVSGPVPVLRRSRDIVTWAHNHGGVALGVHAKQKPTFMSMSYGQLEELAEILDGMEVINGGDLLKTSQTENPGMKELAVKYKLAQTGGSDFHRLDRIGIVTTKVFRDCTTWQDVRQAIIQRQTEPFINSAIPVGTTPDVSLSSMVFSG